MRTKILRTNILTEHRQKKLFGGYIFSHETTFSKNGFPAKIDFRGHSYQVKGKIVENFSEVHLEIIIPKSVDLNTLDAYITVIKWNVLTNRGTLAVCAEPVEVTVYIDDPYRLNGLMKRECDEVSWVEYVDDEKLTNGCGGPYPCTQSPTTPSLARKLSWDIPLAIKEDPRKIYTGTLLYYDKELPDHSLLISHAIINEIDDNIPVNVGPERVGTGRVWYNDKTNAIDCEIIFDNEPGPDKINVGGYYKIADSSYGNIIRCNLRYIMLNPPTTAFKDTFVTRLTKQELNVVKMEEEEMPKIKDVKFTESVNKKTGEKSMITVVKFTDGTTSKARTVKGDKGNWETGLYVAIAKRALNAQKSSTEAAAAINAWNPYIPAAKKAIQEYCKIYDKETKAIDAAKRLYAKDLAQYKLWRRQGAAMFGTRDYDASNPPVKDIPKRTVVMVPAEEAAKRLNVPAKQIRKWARTGTFSILTKCKLKYGGKPKTEWIGSNVPKTTVKENNQARVTWLVPMPIEEV